MITCLRWKVEGKIAIGYFSTDWVHTEQAAVKCAKSLAADRDNRYSDIVLVAQRKHKGHWRKAVRIQQTVWAAFTPYNYL